MTIDTSKYGEQLTFSFNGRMDTTTSPIFEAKLSELDGVSELILDFAQLEYISSAGLRLLLTAQKIMNKQGTMKIKNVNENIYDVFEITGFSDVLTIEK